MMATEAYVTFECPHELMEQALELLCKKHKYLHPSKARPINPTCTAEVEFGRMNPDYLADDSQLLTRAGIPHTILVCSDYEVDATEYHTRFTADGKFVVKVIVEDDYLIPVSALHELLDKPEELRALITERHDALQVLPWDNQLEYSIPARVAARMTGSHK
jgi:hypothetical protein